MTSSLHHTGEWQGVKPSYSRNQHRRFMILPARNCGLEFRCQRRRAIFWKCLWDEHGVALR